MSESSKLAIVFLLLLPPLALILWMCVRAVQLGLGSILIGFIMGSIIGLWPRKGKA
jgi:hypothetical protein